MFTPMFTSLFWAAHKGEGGWGLLHSSTHFSTHSRAPFLLLLPSRGEAQEQRGTHSSLAARFAGDVPRRQARSLRQQQRESQLVTKRAPGCETCSRQFVKQLRFVPHALLSPKALTCDIWLFVREGTVYLPGWKEKKLELRKTKSYNTSFPLKAESLEHIPVSLPQVLRHCLSFCGPALCCHEGLGRVWCYVTAPPVDAHTQGIVSSPHLGSSALTPRLDFKFWGKHTCFLCVCNV